MPRSGREAQAVAVSQTRTTLWLLAFALLTDCNGDGAHAGASSSASALWIPEAPTRESPPSPPPSIVASARGPRTLGSVQLDARALGWSPPAKFEIGAAFAHLREEWPTPRGGLPRLVFDRIDLYSKAVRDASCDGATLALAAPAIPELITLQSDRRVDVEWEKDFAIGDDFDLCFLRPGKQTPSCSDFELGRSSVILSLGRERVKGFINASAAAGTVKGSFNAEICPIPALE